MNAYPQICRKANLKVYHNPQLVIDEFLKKLRSPIVRFPDIHVKNTISLSKQQLLEKEIQYHRNIRLSIVANYKHRLNQYNNDSSYEQYENDKLDNYNITEKQYSDIICVKIRNLCNSYINANMDFSKYIDIYDNRLYPGMHSCKFYGYTANDFNKKIRTIFYDYIVPQIEKDFDEKYEDDGLNYNVKPSPHKNEFNTIKYGIIKTEDNTWIVTKPSPF